MNKYASYHTPAKLTSFRTSRCIQWSGCESPAVGIVEATLIALYTSCRHGHPAALMVMSLWVNTKPISYK